MAHVCAEVIITIFTKGAVHENIHTPPTEGNGISRGGGGGPARSSNLIKCIKLRKCISLRKKSLPWGGVDIIWNYTAYAVLGRVAKDQYRISFLLQHLHVKPLCGLKWNLVFSGAHHQEPATTPYSCHGIFTDRSIFSLNFSRIQVPTGASVTNCIHKHGLACEAASILTKACSCTLEMAYFTGKIAKNRLVCKNAVALAYYGSGRLLVMGSWYFIAIFLFSCRKKNVKFPHGSKNKFFRAATMWQGHS